MAVKNKDADSAQSAEGGDCQNANELSRFWLLYFISTIALIGLFGAYVISVPVYLAGRFARLFKFQFCRSWSLFLTAQADHVMQSGIHLLMAVQPWLNARIEMNLNDNSRSRRLFVAAKNPGEGRLLVSNHRSHLDAFFLLARVRGVRIFAKKSLFQVPFLGMMMRMSRQIPVSREINAFFEAMNHVRDRLRAGDTVHIFPEMTRCAPGTVGTRNFSALPFLIAIQEKVPIIPIVFHSTDLVWPKNRFGLVFRQPVAAIALDPLDPAQFGSAEELRSEVRRRINAALTQPIFRLPLAPETALPHCTESRL